MECARTGEKGLRLVALLRETAILNRIRLTCSKGAVRLWRNNVGAFQDSSGNWIRYGVGGKGGLDLIGWKRITITPEMVGTTLAQYAEIEVKRPGKKPTKDQQIRLEMVAHAGGLCGVAHSDLEAMTLLGVDKV